MGAEDLRRRVLRAVTVVMVGEGCSRLIGFTSVLVLARLLSPRDFGLAAIATLVILGVQTALGVGIPAALSVLSRERRFARATLCAAVVAGSIGCVAVLATADLAARLLGNQAAAPLIRALAPTLILDKWNEVQSALLERQLLFRWTTSSSVVAEALGLLVAILAGTTGAGAWSIVLASLAARCALALLLALPRQAVRLPLWDVALFRQLWSYCRNVLGTGLITFTYTNVDDALISRLVGTVGLGHYRFAYLISNTPAYATTHIVNRVMLPTYAHLISQGHSLRNTYARLVSTVAWVSAVVAAGVGLLGPQALELMYGNKWNPAIPVIRILAVYGFVRAIGSTSGTLFLSLGRPELSRRIAQWQLLAMLPIVVLLTVHFGLVGAAIGVTIPLLFATSYALTKALREIEAPVTRTVRRVIGIAILEIIAAAISAWLGSAMGGGLMGVIGSVLGFGILSALAGASIYPAAAQGVVAKVRQNVSGRVQ